MSNILISCSSPEGDYLKVEDDLKLTLSEYGIPPPYTFVFLQPMYPKGAPLPKHVLRVNLLDHVKTTRRKYRAIVLMGCNLLQWTFPDGRVGMELLRRKISPGGIMITYEKRKKYSWDQWIRNASTTRHPLFTEKEMRYSRNFDSFFHLLEPGIYTARD